MTAAVESGMPKLRIEEAAARRQARQDQGEEIIVGVNRFELEDEEDIDIRSIDNSAVRESQVRRLEQVRQSRDEAACQDALEVLRQAANNPDVNLMDAAVDAALKRASVGEISNALEESYGRHTANIQSIAGVYAAASDGNDEFAAIRQAVDEFAKLEGRRPRMLVVKLGQDGHDRGAKIIATAFADIGFDVDMGPLFQTPEEGARQAIENDVHVIGISSQAAGHQTLVPQLINALDAESAEDIVVVCGGVIPPQDHDALKQSGVSAIYGPGTNIPQAAVQVLELIRAKRKAA